MSYGLVMLIAALLYVAQTVKAQRDALARAEAMQRHPAGRGR